MCSEVKQIAFDFAQNEAFPLYVDSAAEWGLEKRKKRLFWRKDVVHQITINRYYQWYH